MAGEAPITAVDIAQVVASKNPPLAGKVRAPSQNMRREREALIHHLAKQWAQNPNPDRIDALMESLTPASLFSYYQMPFPLDLHQWVFGWAQHPELDRVAPPGIARVRWLFSDLLPDDMLTLGYLYALYKEGDFPQRELLGRLLQEEKPLEALRKRYRLARLLLKEPFRLRPHLSNRKNGG